MNDDVAWRTRRASAGDRFGRRSASSATAPLTTPAAMLLPDSDM